MSTYSRGSEWRRWELHTHTPCSYLNNGFGTDWDVYVKELFSKAIRHNIAAIGLTDYFTIDGYKKIKTEYLDNETKLKELFTPDEVRKIKDILILPNIEFRLSTLVDGSRVNFHVLFSNEVSIQDIEENFLYELNFVAESNPHSEDERWKLKTCNLETLGQRLKSEQQEFEADSDIYVGMKCAVVDDTEIVKILTNKKSKFKDQYLIFIPSDEDLSKINWNGQGHQIRKLLIQKSNGLMASNPKTIQWGLGEFHDTSADFVKEFRSLKPCIWGADAHCYDTLFSPANDRYCWIKANPSFNGLKQITFEPEDRVKISDVRPDEKNDYQLIDHVSFKDPQFSPRRLPINPNLTAIIGGKSTGKSVLLRNIAKTIDSDEVDRRLEDVGLIDYPMQIDDFEVTWKDGQSQKISSQDKISKKIIYIPQSYFNRLVDNEESKTSIDDILKSVLEQTDEIRQSFSSLENEQRDIKKNISKTIENLFFTLEDWQRQHLKIKEKGDKIGIEQGIANLAKEIDVLKASSGMSEDELLKYNQSKDNIDGLRYHNVTLEKDINVLSNLKPLPPISVDTDALSDEIKLKADTHLSLLLHEVQDKWSAFISNHIKQLEEVRKANNLVLSKEQEIVEPLIAKLANATQLTNLSAKYDLEKKKLKQLQVEEQTLDKHANQYTQKLMKLAQTFGKNFEELNKTQETISRSQEALSDIEFELSVEFKSKHFQKEFVDEVFNLKQLSKFSKVALLNYNWININTFQHDIYQIIVGIMDESIVLKKNYSKKEALTKLLQNWYILKYNITYKGDNLSQMSPGKKSFVLLKLLLDLDNSRCPLLLDQPEDDLDNRSIYDELVAYIKKSKKNRQIIIATHNPNLVVSADAEEVIVANQHGDESLNENHQFEYKSNALENSYQDDTSQFTLQKQGIKEHVCDILEGGELAFQKRSEKYNI
tara:strand:+ start:48252 stop:51059 length:2808 start_codon:yes stop_codon:yes gene_type:complete